MVVIVDDENRENEGDLIFLHLMLMQKKLILWLHARGLICLALDKSRFKKLNLKLMTDQNLSRHRTAFTVVLKQKRVTTESVQR